ncbi:MAG: superfamily phosphohydrolase [Thermoleophilia bacterium]|nr:superfamily phosphohydrolase [Thermoleophilia bacterium]
MRTISCPVHDAMPFSDDELALVNAPSMQRLRSVKQLGLAHFVYPSADFSRFSHSLGAAHVVGKLFMQLGARGDTEAVEQRQLYRAATIVHDVGHYPFSHALERIAKDAQADTFLVEAAIEPTEDGSTDPADTPAAGDDSDETATVTEAPDVASEEPGGAASDGAERKAVAADEPIAVVPSYFADHEALGEFLVCNDQVITAALTKLGLDPSEVVSIFRHTTTNQLANLVSSDLDADRIDYLMRTAHATGLPYGAVDLQYLLSQMSRDSVGKVKLSSKALKAADHFLLSRYFAYLQVSFHKTVAGLEHILVDAVRGLFEHDMLALDRPSIEQHVAEGTWQMFDDNHVLSLFSELHKQVAPTSTLALKLQGILLRRPPRMIWSSERLESRSTKQEFSRRVREVEGMVDELASQTTIPRDRWFVWKRSVVLTSVGSKVSITDLDPQHQEFQSGDIDLSIRVERRDGSSIPIMQDPRSLFSVLADHAWNCVRLYVVATDEELESSGATAKADAAFRLF